jgi:predicted GNAT family N-acyltransferase
MESASEITVKFVENDWELKEAFSIRRTVFIEEQNVPEVIELDSFDKTAAHILAFDREKPIGTARWRTTGNGIKLERFAVLKEFRGMGIGKLLVQFIMEHLGSDKKIYLHAQESVVAFYEKFDFQVQGELFSEADIPHRLMIYNGERN